MGVAYQDGEGINHIGNVRDMLIREEGRVSYCYKDSMGFDTIGCGRLVDRRKGGGLSDAEIDYLLDNDIASKTAELTFALPWVVDLDEPRKAVLIGMAFQLGTEGLLKFVNTLSYVHYGKYDQAADGLLQSLWAKQTPERAHRMANQMRTGQWS